MQPFQWLTTPIARTPTLIEASAGTGKTYAITGLFLRMLLEGHASQVRQILVVTFTRAATRELTQRIRARLQEALAAFRGDHADTQLQHLVERYGDEGRATLARACLELEELAIFTIHGFCKRLLEQNAFESGLTFSPTFLDDHQDILDEAARDFWRRTFLANSPILAELAVAKKWSPTSLLKAVNSCRAQTGINLYPEVVSFSQTVQTVETEFENLPQAWDRHAVGQALATFDFLSKVPFAKTDQVEFLDLLEGACRIDPPADSLEAVTQIHTYLDVKFLKKKQHSKPDILALMEHPFFLACSRIGTLIESLEISLRHEFLNSVEQNFQRLKQRAHQLDYDDLLHQLSEVINDPTHGHAIKTTVATQYSAALIDEFQDTDQIQFSIFHQLFPSAPLFFIGDPKQAIYSFRGADLHAYLAARKVTGQQYTLGTNWRSHQNLVDAVNQLFLSKDDPFLQPEIAYDAVQASGRVDDEVIADDGKAMHWWLLPKDVKAVGPVTDLVLQRVVREITDFLSKGTLLGERPMQPSDFAVLVRTNDQAQEVLQVLRAAGLPALFADSGDIFQTREMDELVYFIRAVLSPQKPGRLQTAMSGLIWGANANDIYALNQDEQRLREAIEHLEALRSIWARHGFLTMIQAAFTRFGTQTRLLAMLEGQQCLANLRHASEILQQYADREALTPESLLRWVQKEKDRTSHEGLETKLRLAASESAIQIMTIHKAKGLEYQVVFCPFLWKGRAFRKGDIPKFHDEDGALSFDLQPTPDPEHREKAAKESAAEDLRLLYVALTRAKQRCYVAWGKVSSQKAVLALLVPETLEDCQAWIDENGDLMCWEMLSPTPEPVTELILEPPPTGHLQPPKPFKPPTRQLDPWRITSFTSLVSGKDGGDHRDRDPAPREQLQGTGIFGFARGPRPGNCLHEIFEHMDFSNSQSQETQTLIEKTLARFDLLDPKRHPAPLDPVEVVQTMLYRVCTCPLPGQSFSLSQIDPTARLNEWAFHLPIHNFQPNHFYEHFQAHASEAVPPTYAQKLKAWRQTGAFDGFLTGFVDLCFVQNDRWYLIDWKSNDLGPSPSDYDSAGLLTSMADHHYLLQYHLYALALHRFLRSRLPDYRYDRHFGGIFYAFLRGIDGKTSRGWYADRPSVTFMDALDRMCQTGGAR